VTVLVEELPRGAVPDDGVRVASVDEERLGAGAGHRTKKKENRGSVTLFSFIRKWKQDKRGMKKDSLGAREVRRESVGLAVRKPLRETVALLAASPS
jgi:hypothetical protein